MGGVRFTDLHQRRFNVDLSEQTASVVVKEERSDEEYIDVVNYFENEVQKASEANSDLTSTHKCQTYNGLPVLATGVFEDDNSIIDLTDTLEVTNDIHRNQKLQREQIQLVHLTEIDKQFTKEKPRREDQRYEVLKQQLASEPLTDGLIITANLNNQIEKQISVSNLNKQRLQEIYYQTPPNHERPTVDSPQTVLVVDESVLYSNHVDDCQPDDTASELKMASKGRSLFCAEDAALRYRVLVFLWILLGERRLCQVGYPAEAIHLVLWRVVHICCAVQGVKSAAAVALPDDHDCGRDMLCFRDHVHRFLEVCAPTREHWKTFGWASLTVDAVIKKIYERDLLPTLFHRIPTIPAPIRTAMCKLVNIDKMAAAKLRSVTRWRRVPKMVTSVGGSRTYVTSQYRPILPKPTVIVEKKKRGRPVKINSFVADSAGKIERVMLWRFVLNLLEEPSNAACIHWINRDEGIFRILNTDWLARIWGRRHGNPRMTYEKMARAMRTYYRSKVLQPVPRNINLPRKLVYKFNPALVRRVTAK